MRNRFFLFLGLMVTPILPAASGMDFSRPQTAEDHPAGTGSTPRRMDAKAFSAPLAGLSPADEVDFKLGNALFRAEWQPANADAGVFSGLGPLYNARSCVQCHIEDGRGIAPEGPDQGAGSLLLRLGPKDPNYGAQLQDFAVEGAKAEYRLQVTYSPRPVQFADGTVITLRQPVYALANLSKGPLHPDSRISPRLAPPMIGLGLIEAIPAADILAGADPDDSDGDGISGRANRVLSVETGAVMLGRFGLKAGSPTIRQQVALALLHDMGISNPLFYAPGKMAEITTFNFDFLTAYSALIGVPVRVNVGAKQVLRGKQVFYETGCAACHRPRFLTAGNTVQPQTSGQVIWPYSDFLLHDMGDGLADGFPEGLASGQEWRTPPLWGIGLTETVSGQANFLHDGRARTLLEAILWHGGEAVTAQARVREMPAGDRAALLVFLESL